MEPFIGMIGVFGFDYPPRGWAKCDGQVLLINDNQALYSVIGTTYGGDGRTTFQLPDLRGRVPLSFGDAYAYPGLKGGAEQVRLAVSNLPPHSHSLLASSQAAAATPGGNAPAKSETVYREKTGDTVQMHSGSITNTGGSGFHENRQPYLAVNYCIALRGAFPSRS